MNDYNHHVDSFDENCWSDLIDYSGLLDEAVPPADICWNPQPTTQNGDVAIDASLGGTSSQARECVEERECRRKRGRSDECGGTGSKACRERMRREKLNDRFSELSTILEPGRPMKTDKLAILGDAIRILNQLKTESQEYKEMNEKLLEEIKTLKAEKNELREEKLVLKADKERIEQQLKTMAIPPSGFMPAHPSIYQTGANKMAMFPGYGLVPMWQYLPPSARDTSQDHELRPPAA
ncbi:transcription factor bHLH104 [Sesamum indicum]|uniref:Transcription factor bHLH104 n=1 Tax=Sesamum indicum TaxID=4182 RepID=A0A6I9STT3_SESIN|nr:transcription factor bHLH104 [Sesamum indicum]